MLLVEKLQLGSAANTLLQACAFLVEFFYWFCVCKLPHFREKDHYLFEYAQGRQKTSRLQQVSTICCSDRKGYTSAGYW